jgi:thiol-disulfide isomerase/thioredoxin
MHKNVKLSVLLVMTLFPAMIFSQEFNRRINDPKLNQEILYGYCDRNGLETGDFGEIFAQYYKLYIPDKLVIKELRLHKDGIEILIVLGTWCSDSQEQVPKFFKVLDKIRFNKSSVEMICVSRDKEAGEVETAKFDIRKVPTFIIFRNGKEAGRIIETPYTTLEKDLLMFFTEN